ncbi:T-cell surface glycoprotein CD1b-3-like [Pseudopipra pipra]|uniref:T-cell surface glycoprotein CD1b-3-like n=1 Tax=Pseudopipra pipra TaxID=415032 RepID=UPI003138D5BD
MCPVSIHSSLRPLSKQQLGSGEGSSKCWHSSCLQEGNPSPSRNLSPLSAPPDPFVVQSMAGCKLYPNKTSQVFFYVGYNGQDFLSLDTDNASWTLSQDTDLARYVRDVLQNYTSLSELVEGIFKDTCDNAMEMFLNYGRAALERQELPVATVFARTPSPHQLLLVCHVTAFYPRPISVAWLRDGHEVPPGPQLNTSPVLPNADLTYQLSSVLAVAPQDGHSYACRVRHRSLGTRSLLVPWGRCHPGARQGAPQPPTRCHGAKPGKLMAAPPSIAQATHSCCSSQGSWPGCWEPWLLLP